MKYKYLIPIIVIFFLSIYIANATTYYEAEVLRISYNVYTNEATDDIGASLTDSYCMDPDDSYATKKAFTVIEEDQTNMPGIWYGNYTIPATPLSGVWRCIARFTNANGTTATATKSFRVGDALSTQINISALETHGDATWTTGTGNITGAACVTVDDKTGYTIINPGNNTGAVCVAVEDKTGYSLTTEDWTTSNDLNISLAAQSEIDNETLADIKVEIEDMNGTTLVNMMQRIEDMNDTTLLEMKIEIETIETNVTDMSNYMHEEGVTGFFYKLLKTVFSWLGAGESLEERLATQDNITKLQGELQGINDNISSMNDTTLLEMKQEIEALDIDLSGIGANISSMNDTTLLEMKQEIEDMNGTTLSEIKWEIEDMNGTTLLEIKSEIEALNVSVSTAVNETLISECVWGLVNPDVCGVWRTIHSWV